MLRRMLAAAAIVAVALSVSGSSADRVPGLCAGTFHPGPVSVSCRLTHQGHSIFAFGAVVNTSIGTNPTIVGPVMSPNAAFVIIDVFTDTDPPVPVAECSFHGENGVLPPLFAGPCIGGGPTDLEIGTPLRCRARGRTYGTFGCLSRMGFESIFG